MAEPDDTIISLVSDLTACLCAELAAAAGTEEPPTCFCTPIPGSFPGQAYAGLTDDVAWVRVFDFFPSNRPGEQIGGPLNTAVGWSVMIEIGVMRCVQLPKNSEWSGGLLHDAWLPQMRDLGAMVRAIQCCTGRTWTEDQIAVGNYAPMGLEGNLNGARIPLAVQIEF